MDRFGEWRPIEPASENGEPKAPAEPVAKSNSADVRFVGLLTAGVLAVVGAFIWFTGSGSAGGVSVSGAAAYFEPAARGSAAASERPQESAAAVLVDVEGAVVNPGLHSLPAGSRVGDAIAAAGGYSARVDIAAAAAVLNLAAPLADGTKVQVPARGEAATTSQQPILGEQPAVVVEPGGGLIDVNTATAEQLDTLPGIGPVTAAKIIAAREQTPFASVDELLSREVVGAQTFEKLRALVSVGP